jgi:hypothetical protein
MVIYKNLTIAKNKLWSISRNLKVSKNLPDHSCNNQISNYFFGGKIPGGGSINNLLYIRHLKNHNYLREGFFGILIHPD